MEGHSKQGNRFWLLLSDASGDAVRLPLHHQSSQESMVRLHGRSSGEEPNIWLSRARGNGGTSRACYGGEKRASVTFWEDLNSLDHA